MKAGLTHAGFGGTCEFINAGLPMLCFPHFGDQPMNSKLIKEIGIGEILIDVKHCRGKSPRNGPPFHKKPIFTKEDIQRLFSKVLNEESYQTNMRRVRLRKEMAGGRKLAGDTIEKAYIAGDEHLVDRHYVNLSKSVNKFRSCIGLIFLLAFLAAFIYLAIDKFDGEIEDDEL